MEKASAATHFFASRHIFYGRLLPVAHTVRRYRVLPHVPQAFPPGGHNSPGDCCGFHRQCGSYADATGNLQRWWHLASHGSPMTDEVGLVAQCASSEAIACRYSTSSVCFADTFPSRGRLWVRPVAHTVRRYRALAGGEPGGQIARAADSELRTIFSDFSLDKSSFFCYYL